MNQPCFTVITLGCPRNYVDSQYWVRYFLDRGYYFTSWPEEADVVLINTCGFIEPAVKESVDVILQIENLYLAGRVKEVIIAGCLVERYRDELRAEFPYAKLIGCLPVRNLSEKRLPVLQEGGFAYVKICEGCVKRCSFCTIPFIRGKLTSRKVRDIVEEIKYYESLGKNEIVIIGQDTTSYGWDLYGKPSLGKLLKEILNNTSVPWIRIMYTYPSLVDDELLDMVAKERRLVNYLDVPIQHVDDWILSRMQRGYGYKEVEVLFQKAKERGIELRTTVIVGFPGEDRRKFSLLKRFLESSPASRIGVFKYYREKGTRAFGYRNQVKDSVKRSRYYSIRRLAQEILVRKRIELDGKEDIVIVDGMLPQEKLYIARTFRDAPEVDDVVFVKSKEELFSGDIVKVRFSFDSSSKELFAEKI